MSDLHKEYGKMKLANFSQGSRDRFKNVCESRGFQPSKNFEKIINDPDPKFTSVVKELENFHKSTIVPSIRDEHEPYKPKRIRPTEVKVGTPANEKLKAFRDFEQGRMSMDQLRVEIGEETFERARPMLKNAEDGRYTKAAQQILIDEDKRHFYNDNPVKNQRELFSEVQYPDYGSRPLI